jgi:hypothetical protein
VLKVRRAAGREVLSLFEEGRGTIALPREWTDQVPPPLHSAVLDQPSILHAPCLLKLCALSKLIGEKIDDAK